MTNLEPTANNHLTESQQENLRQCTNLIDLELGSALRHFDDIVTISIPDSDERRKLEELIEPRELSELARNPEDRCRDIGKIEGITILEEHDHQESFLYRCPEYVFHTLKIEPWAEQKGCFPEGIFRDVEDYLSRRGYLPRVGCDIPQVGDVVVYQNFDVPGTDRPHTYHFGELEKGNRVRSKFGYGFVYSHQLNQVPTSYGTQAIFFYKDKDRLDTKPEKISPGRYYLPDSELRNRIENKRSLKNALSMIEGLQCRKTTKSEAQLLPHQFVFQNEEWSSSLNHSYLDPHPIFDDTVEFLKMKGYRITDSFQDGVVVIYRDYHVLRAPDYRPHPVTKYFGVVKDGVVESLVSSAVVLSHLLEMIPSELGQEAVLMVKE